MRPFRSRNLPGGSSRFPSLSLPLLHLLLFLLPACLTAQTSVTVNTTDDLDDGSCDAAHCSLREALNAAAQSGAEITIAFDIPGSGPHTLRPTSPLPSLVGSTTLDGTTEPDYAGTPVIELDGTNAGDMTHGLNLAGSENTIRGLILNRFSGNGISIGAEATNNRVEGCYIGTDATGSSALGNGNAGVLIGEARNNTVGGTTVSARNVISGNVEGVTVLDVTATGNLIQGNYIGTNAVGDAAIPNATGVLLLAPDNTVGGVQDGAGNLISGNRGDAVNLASPNATGNLIAGNYLGVDASGTTALGNDIGVRVDNVADNIIGGTETRARNVISGNREGITFWEVGATGNLVQGNYVGTNAAGDAPIPNQMGIPVYSPGNTIGGTAEGAGNLISGNLINGVNFYGESATGNVLLGNLIGTDASGTAALGNGENGVALLNGAIDNVVGGAEAGAGNIISGNNMGILVADFSVTGTRIQGNYIGTNSTGDSPLPNTTTGILVWGEETLIGGSEEGAGNVISGNTFAGIDLGPGSTGTTIQGNYIGTDASGSTAMGNDLGIWANFSPNNTIGGTAPGAGNVISGNLGSNLIINGLDAAGNTIQGNYIGPDASGTAALATGRALLILDAPDNTIGGIESGAGNVISGNHLGISVEGATATGNLFQGNYIGVDATGSAAMGNRGAGIRFTNGAASNTVGGTEPGSGNVIANSSWVGISVFPEGGSGNRILGNAIFDNGALGIELNRDGVNPIDEGDTDTGPNNLQNFPEINLALANGGGIVQASLNSIPNATFTLDFFSDTACDETGYGEGRTPLGTASLSTDASGTGTVTASFSGITGSLVTATATDAEGSTSEFSACASLSTLGMEPSPGSRTVTQGQSAGYTISVAAEGGTFDETVELACSGNPAGTTCTFDQDQVALTGGSGSATMTVTTVAPAASDPGIPGSSLKLPPGLKPLLPSLLTLLLGAALLLVLMRRSNRGMPFSGGWPGGRTPASRVSGRRRGANALRVGLAVLLLLAFNSCGDDGTRPPTGGTPPGTYEITVAGTWESLEVSTAVTLVVQQEG